MTNKPGLLSLLVDTNILLRIAQFETEHDAALLRTLREYRSQGATICITLQNLAEFWNVATRQHRQNDLGRSLSEVADEVDSIAAWFNILPETHDTFIQWRQLVETFEVTGATVHDARLAAIMLKYGIKEILTFIQKTSSGTLSLY